MTGFLHKLTHPHSGSRSGSPSNSRPTSPTTGHATSSLHSASRSSIDNKQHQHPASSSAADEAELQPRLKSVCETETEHRQRTADCSRLGLWCGPQTERMERWRPRMKPRNESRKLKRNDSRKKRSKLGWPKSKQRKRPRKQLMSSVCTGDLATPAHVTDCAHTCPPQDFSADKYGKLPLVQSTERTGES